MGQRNRNWVQIPKGIDFAKIFLWWVPWNHMKQLFMNTSISTNIWMYLPSCSQASNQYYNWVILDHFDLDIKSTFAIVPHMNYFMSTRIHSEKAPSSALTNTIDSYWVPNCVHVQIPKVQAANALGATHSILNATPIHFWGENKTQKKKMHMNTTNG